MASNRYSRSRTGAAARAKALGKLVRAEDVPAGDEFLDLFDQIDREFRWGAVWTRPGIDKRTRAMLALAMVAAKCQADAVRTHVRLCVNTGLSKAQIGEVLLHVYCYAGVYASLSGFQAAKQVFDELERAGLLPAQRRALRVLQAPTRTAAARTAEGLRIRRALLGPENVDAALRASDGFMHMFNDLTHEFCFGNIWARPALEWRTRSQLTLAIAAATSQFGAVNRHVRSAVRAGLSRKRIGEIFLLAYPYGGAYACFGSFSAARHTFAEIARERKAAAKVSRPA